MAKSRQSKNRKDDDDAIEWLGRQISSATIATYIQMFPFHDGAAELLRVAPELKAQRDSYYREIARRLIALGIKLPDF